MNKIKVIPTIPDAIQVTLYGNGEKPPINIIIIPKLKYSFLNS